MVSSCSGLHSYRSTKRVKVDPHLIVELEELFLHTTTTDPASSLEHRRSVHLISRSISHSDGPLIDCCQKWMIIHANDK